MGMVLDDVWEALSAEFDSRAERLTVLVKALDPTYDTTTFYSPEPVNVWEAYPKARKMLSEGERQWYRDHWDGDITADAFFAQLDALQESRTLQEWTKMQWPGCVIDIPGHRIFKSDPAFVRVFDERFNTLRAWAAERARQERDAKAAKGRKVKTGEPPVSDPQGPISARALAKRYGLSPEPLRKRLDRRRKEDSTCFVETTDREAREPRYLYHFDKVKDIITDLGASVGASAKRPSPKKST